jgi:hypothetical protein
MAVCWNCGQSYDPPDPITRESECPCCAAYLRCCRNCTFYEPGTHNDCREPQAELQPDKEVANACDYFRAADVPKNSGGGKPKRDIRDLFNDA